MEFDIDVSGEDIFNKDYAICVSNNQDIIKGIKFDSEIISILRARFGQEFYKYSNSKSGKAFFKVRLYCIAVLYIFKTIELNKETIMLNICQDFDGHSGRIRDSLTKMFLSEMGIILDKVSFLKLSNNSFAHKYAYLMRKDTKNQLRHNYVKITLEDIEKFLK